MFRRRENGNFWIPLLVVTLTATALLFVNSAAHQAMFEGEFNRAMAKKAASLTPDQIQSSRAIAETFQKFATIIAIPILILVVGCWTWLVGKLFDSRQTIGAALVVVAYANVVRILEGVLVAVQSLLLDPSTFTSRYSIQIGPARFLDPDTASPVVLALLGRLDVFTLWVTVLLALGLAVTGRVSRERAVLAGVLFWVVGTIPVVLSALSQ